MTGMLLLYLTQIWPTMTFYIIIVVQTFGYSPAIK